MSASTARQATVRPSDEVQMLRISPASCFQPRARGRAGPPPAMAQGTPDPGVYFRLFSSLHQPPRPSCLPWYSALVMFSALSFLSTALFVAGVSAQLTINTPSVFVIPRLFPLSQP